MTPGGPLHAMASSGTMMPLWPSSMSAVALSELKEQCHRAPSISVLNEALRHCWRRTHPLREPLKVTGHEHARGRRGEEDVHVVTVADGLRGTGKADDGLHRVGFRVGDEFHEDAATHARPKALDDLNHPWVLNNRRVSQKLPRPWPVVMGGWSYVCMEAPAMKLNTSTVMVISSSLSVARGPGSAVLTSNST